METNNKSTPTQTFAKSPYFSSSAAPTSSILDGIEDYDNRIYTYFVFSILSIPSSLLIIYFGMLKYVKIQKLF